MSASLERLKRWVRRTVRHDEDRVEGGSPAATPPVDANPVGIGEDERETSTNAQAEGAAGEPWPGNS
jgi:hypothetical protein